MESATPTAQAAAEVVWRQLGKDVAQITRFPTGLANVVYDVLTTDGTALVVRLVRVGEGARFAGAVYWHERLAPLGVPLPRLIAHDAAPAQGDFPYMIIERLPGTDLGVVYPDLTATQKQGLARQIVAIQRAAATLPDGPGFGYARSYADSLHRSWAAVLRANLAQSRRAIERAALVDPRVVERVTAKLPTYDLYLARVQPHLFLDDTTTKNVLIAGGRLSGIVDVDVVCFGDRLLTPALTQMALLSRGHDTDYIRSWCDELDLSGEQERILTLYTAHFCVGFLAELGQPFNKEVAETIEAGTVERLLAILDSLLARC